SSLRFFINKVAVKAGYLHRFDRENPTWKITSEGREFVASAPALETTVNVETSAEEAALSNSAQGNAFELWILKALRKFYPHYAWYHQGRAKRDERGLDFVASRIGDAREEDRSIGVQVKFHKATNAPTSMEWLKFLSGCFARRV